MKILSFQILLGTIALRAIFDVETSDVSIPLRFAMEKMTVKTIRMKL